jgi:RimJ/RimL family protein N-acetyltransferase
MSNGYWPLFDLRLHIDDLELRPMTEADQELVARTLPDDLELDPSATTYDGEDPRVARGRVMHQGYWKGYGTWHPDAWRLRFVVLRDGTLLGAQELEGNDFPVLRTVDSASFLVAEVRGQGVGKLMRRAVLALAFGPLEATAAITSAWHDNTASLGVSRSLGYQPNGMSLERRRGPSGQDAPDTMVHLRLTREDWDASGAAGSVRIEGFEPCRRLFGLA